MHLVARARCLPPLNVSNTTHDQVPGIGRELQNIVHHTLAQTRERIEANCTLKQGTKGMKASHSLIQRKGKGRGRRNLIQEIFTQRKSITYHKYNHVQKPEAVTVTCTPEVIYQILCRPNIAQDHDPNHQYIHSRKTVTNIETLPQRKKCVPCSS